MRKVIVGQNTTEAVGKRRAGNVMEEDSLLERVTAGPPKKRQLSHNSFIAYRRAWLRIILAERCGSPATQISEVPGPGGESVRVRPEP
jgi:hypothetical protein